MLKLIVLAFLLGTLGTYIRLQLINKVKNPHDTINLGLLLANIIGTALAVLFTDLNPVYSIALCGALTSMSALIKAGYQNVRYLIITYTSIYLIFHLTTYILK